MPTYVNSPTPLPWSLEHIREHEGCGCCTFEFSEADAALILEAVNSHARLLAEREELARELQKAGRIISKLNRAARYYGGDAYEQDTVCGPPKSLRRKERSALLARIGGGQ